MKKVMTIELTLKDLLELARNRAFREVNGLFSQPLVDRDKDIEPLKDGGVIITVREGKT